MIKTQPVADGGSLVNRVKNKLPRITIRTLRAPYFYPDPLPLALDSAHDDVVKRTRSINSCFSRHTKYKQQAN